MRRMTRNRAGRGTRQVTNTRRAGRSRRRSWPRWPGSRWRRRRAPRGPRRRRPGSAHAVTYQSATLTGTVHPNGIGTSYYFQYGITKGYGGQTAIATRARAPAAVNVSLPAGGLQPLTQYHYRIVAVNSAGPAFGADRSFMTTKVPLSLAIAVTPSPVLFGGNGHRPGHALRHRKRQPRGGPAGQHLPVRGWLPEPRQP